MATALLAPLAKYMAINLRVQGQLHALDNPRSPPAPSVWSRVATNEVLLYDVLYGEYFKSPGGETLSISTFHIEESKNPCRARHGEDELFPGRLGPRPRGGAAALLPRPHQDIRHLHGQDCQDILATQLKMIKIYFCEIL